MSDYTNKQSPVPPSGWDGQSQNQTPSAPSADDRIEGQAAPGATVSSYYTSPSSYSADEPTAAQSAAQNATSAFSFSDAQAQPEYAASSTATAVTPKKNRQSLKTFGLAFVGALVACVLCLGIYSAVNSGSSSSGTGSSSSTTITVDGEDTTLAEAVAEKCLPSVVNIDVYEDSSSYYGLYGLMEGTDSSSDELVATSLGSGVILTSDGYILTNYHVIEDADALQVTANGTEYEAEVVGTDESSDLAVIKIDAEGLTAMEIGSSSDLNAGEWVMAIGSPYGLEQSVSTGIVSATNRTAMSDDTSAAYTNLIQTDAAINSGNSGGALVDSEGKLIGINTLIVSSSGSSSGVGFAIPVDYAYEIATQLMNGETPSHAYLGVSTTSIDSDTANRYGLSTDSGAYISTVASGSAAEDAGLQEGDIIIAVDDEEVTSSSDLVLAIRSHSVGDTITITYVRDGSETTVEATLGSDAS